MSLTIREIDTFNRRDRETFLKLPFDVYASSPYWVPPFSDEAALQVDRKKYSYFKINEAAFFLAERDGKAVGRLAALNPRHTNEFKSAHDLYFFLLEGFEDEEAFHRLLDAAAAWGRERGLTRFRGPLGFAPFDPIGMLAVGFEHHPAPGISYNLEYYPRFVESWGMQLEERVYSGYLNVEQLLNDFPERILSVAEKVKARYGFRIKTYKTKRAVIANVVDDVVEIYNQALTHIAGDPPLPRELVQQVVENVVLIADPRMLKFIEKDGSIVGFLFCFLDPTEGIRKAKGRLSPLGLAHILWSLRTTDWISLNGMGLLPKYHGMGGTSILYAELYHTLKEFPRFKHADVVQISEFNAASLNEMKKFGVDFYKTHHIYQRELTS